MPVQPSLTAKPLRQQVIVITGASSGIGLVTARAAAARGARVVLVARDGEALKPIVTDIEENGGSAIFAVADVGRLEDVRHAATVAQDHFGRIDTWVNNAGVAIYAKLVDTPMAEHERMFRTNYFGVVHGCLTALDHMRETGGTIITVASIAADIPSPIMGAYSASKHAIKGYINSLRIEVVADRLPVTITLIKPSGISTPIAKHAANHVEGEALIPPPAYDPALVAEAILDAAEHPRRNVTVGGAGLLQTLLVQHFPRGLDHLGRWFEQLLSTDTGRKTQTDNLGRPVGNGDERSPDQTGKPFSLYAAARRRPATMLMGTIVAAAAGFLATRSRKS